MLERPLFTPFDERKAVVIYRRNLPHWRQAGATYFVTFRLADSLPNHLIKQWEAEKRAWLAARGISDRPGSADSPREFQLQLSKEQAFEFQRCFNRKLNTELDRGIGSCALRCDPCLTIVRDRLFEGDGKLYHLGDFVIMPNHVHLLINLTDGTELEKPLQLIKGGSAFQCNRATAKAGAFWQRESYDHLVRDATELQALRKYIGENPQKAGIPVSANALHSADWLSSP